MPGEAPWPESTSSIAMLKILGRNSSSNVQKILWVCAEFGLGNEREDIGGSFGGNDRPDYLAMNPNGLVPTIIDDGFVLWESNTIVRYLAAKHPAGNLYPTDLQQCSIAQQWMDWQQTTVAPAIRPLFWALIRTPLEKRDHAEIANARDRLAGVMRTLDDRLSRSEYVAGDNFTVGDIPLGIMAYRWFNLDIEREEMGHLVRWYESLSVRPAFQEHVMIGMA